LGHKNHSSAAAGGGGGFRDCYLEKILNIRFNVVSLFLSMHSIQAKL